MMGLDHIEEALSIRTKLRNLREMLEISYGDLRSVDMYVHRKETDYEEVFTIPEGVWEIAFRAWQEDVKAQQAKLRIRAKEINLDIGDL